MYVHNFCLELPMLLHPKILSFPPGTSCIVVAVFQLRSRWLHFVVSNDIMIDWKG
jgi:hypothetical protein